MWLLNTITKAGELFKMTQFKDKSGIQKEGANEKISISAGLLNYPILMAADILLYNTNVVPVGKDQTQHIEIARILARRFNKKFGKIFNIPTIYTSKAGKRIMALDNPNKKMSKSARSINGRIEILDKPDIIRKKIMRATTDSENKIYYSGSPEKAGIKNLLNIFSIINNSTPEKIAENYSNKGYGDLKKDLAEKIINYLKPIQNKFNNITDKEILEIFAKSKIALLPQAEKMIIKAKKAMGLE